jgi:hypothetical protein
MVSHAVGLADVAFTVYAPSRKSAFLDSIDPFRTIT